MDEGIISRPPARGGEGRRTDGVIKVVLSHPARLLADTLVRAMAEAVQTNRTPTVSQHTLPFEIFTAANI